MPFAWNVQADLPDDPIPELQGDEKRESGPVLVRDPAFLRPLEVDDARATCLQSCA